MKKYSPRTEIISKIKSIFRRVAVSNNKCFLRSSKSSTQTSSSLSKEFLLSLLKEEKYQKKANALFQRWGEEENQNIIKKYNID